MYGFLKVILEDYIKEPKMYLYHLQINLKIFTPTGCYHIMS